MHQKEVLTVQRFNWAINSLFNFENYAIVRDYKCFHGNCYEKDVFKGKEIDELTIYSLFHKFRSGLQDGYFWIGEAHFRKNLVGH